MENLGQPTRLAGLNIHLDPAADRVAGREIKLGGEYRFLTGKRTLKP